MPISRELPGLSWYHPEDDQREMLEADESAHDLAGARVDDGGGDLAVGGDLEFAGGEVPQQQAVLQDVPGADHGGAGQLGRDLVRVEQVGAGRRGRLRWRTAGRVRRAPTLSSMSSPNCWCSSSAVAAAHGASQIMKGGCLPSSSSGMGYGIKVPGC